jgi:hypothetical protein
VGDVKFDLTLVIVALIGAAGPTALVIANSRSRSREKAEDRAWQERRDLQLKEDRDEVQRVAAEATRAAQASQKAIAAGTEKVVAASTQAAATLVASNKEVAEHVAAASQAHGEKLEAIHTLVNSAMLRQMGVLRNALESNVQKSKAAYAGRQPAAEEIAEVETVQAQIDQLDKDIEELSAATKFADAAEDYRAVRAARGHED